MKKAAVIIAAAVCLVAACVIVANAAVGDHGIKSRIEEQQKRIDHGVKTGQLNRHEAEIVQDNLNRIKTLEAKMARDGVVAPKEKRRLEHVLDRNGKMIAKEKHNPIRRIN